ncbi:unnamed protein product (macronuclear) [Paramecium tetraurelia]|uniref:GB1/RHD3-type G domain-containing protein n=1 Tax=Paramecium tetraurelia TaxID=5888 RepID=A0EHM6_PARTE|nr:uncharacterized protein GSPATT00027143001 [Paramecium tetraurelia]CAK94817.1 unnamed protein product [Paramecium tetraurelia]|eukprot:XP_001462190.1 hypothetical protein (macronuclear) [Paramecium tetraurelia strain d4-2]
MNKGPRAMKISVIISILSSELKLEQEAIEIIQSFADKCKNFAVVVVVGKYRTGKSYLINQVLLQQNQGFNVGSTVNACTKGLWMWSEIIHFESGRSKEPIPAILIDTEGIGSLEEEQNHDVKIFLLAMLMSSYFIYNSVGTIDDMALQNLGLIVNLTKMLQKTDESTQKDLFETFPSFLWILRDFTLRLEDEFGNKITPKDYLENALKPLKGFSETIENKNKIRRHITQFFQERDCMTLVRPTQDEKDLQHLSQLKFTELRTEFQEQLTALRKKFSYKISLKQYKGKPTTPFSFVEMCKHFVNTINEGNMPVIETQWQMICKQELNRTLIGGLKIYKDSIDDLLQQNGISQEQLEKSHNIFVRKVKYYLENNCLDKESEEFSTAKKMIKQQIQELYVDAQQRLNKKHEEELEEIKTQFLNKLNEQQQQENIWELVVDLNQKQTMIWNSGANQNLQIDYIQQIQQNVMNKIQYEFKKLSLQLKQQCDNGNQIQEDIKEQKQRYKKQEDDLYEKITQMEKDKNQLRVELESEKNKNLRQQQQILQSQTTVDNKVSEYMNKLKQIEKSYNDQLNEKDVLIQNSELKQKQYQNELDKVKALQKQQDNLNQQEIANLRREIERLKDEISDKSETITKLKQSLAETENVSQYSSLQPSRRIKNQDEHNTSTFNKDLYEYQISTLQAQLDEQKKLTQNLFDAFNSQNNLQKSIYDNMSQSQNMVNNNKLYQFLNVIHQLIGQFVGRTDEREGKDFKSLIQKLFNLFEDNDNSFINNNLTDRPKLKNSDSQRIEKTMSSESPKNSNLSNCQNINPFRSPDQPKYQNNKMTIMQMFMQHKNKEKDQEKLRKSAQLENVLKNRNNMHVQRKIY